MPWSAAWGRPVSEIWCLLLLHVTMQKQLQHQRESPDITHPSPSEGNSSRRSSASGAAPSDDDEGAEQQLQEEPVAEGPYSAARQRDKEWAALTTWLRMNLHHVSGWKPVVA